MLIGAFVAFIQSKIYSGSIAPCKLRTILDILMAKYFIRMLIDRRSLRPSPFVGHHAIDAARSTHACRPMAKDTSHVLRESERFQFFARNHVCALRPQVVADKSKYECRTMLGQLRSFIIYSSSSSPSTSFFVFFGDFVGRKRAKE